ncbi:metalloregulator ArsR/SmtB family transcription factor [Imperialibacter roseus]|uniref:Metalloregulator ArsR/SmtB family transcription factor n=1 Tax=Imperialibacter roseus TaxID=1324217 RepID=A0ABZ0IWG3_9BACT|nr:metalloregulator ArsR/SmtB family transcription factor [Imperialibacter roseus]WOK09388.1 metalloregulator ArsR/SmtB family transcription factor [Imperialibacter roseus]|tara:strand:+ start:2342 stop:2665 length:324 start_codon:yes stop_codon:yes gene_type:complete
MTHTQYDSFLALADKNRREILMLLTKEKSSINTLAESFKISRPAVSKHIKVLVDTGFITIEERGRERLCSLNSQGFEEIQSWINHFEKFWKQHLSSLEVLLKKKGKE